MDVSNAGDLCGISLVLKLKVLNNVLKKEFKLHCIIKDPKALETVML